MVLPQSTHPAYFAAAADLGVTPIVVPIDGDGRAPVGTMVAAIRDDTVLMVASAPSYTHGAIDPIAWIGAAAAAKQVPLHVEATSGGWSLAYGGRAGRVTRTWGFAVDGVTSMTLDVGPDCGAPADLTVLLRRTSTDHLPKQTSWPARGPLDLPAAWAPAGRLLADVVETVSAIGQQGCSELATSALRAVAALVAGLMEIPGIRPAAYPDATVITLRTDTTCDPFTLADELQRRGWATHLVVPEGGEPVLRFPVTPAMLPLVEDCLSAFLEAAYAAQQRGRARVDVTLERLLVSLDPDARDHGPSEYTTHLLLDAAAVLDADPEQESRRAATNLLLVAAEDGVREALVAAHLERLSRPARAPAQPATSASTVDSE